MEKPIHEPTWGHFALRSYTDLYLYTFYDKVTVIGKNNVPKDKPVILAINHQNALMDALTTLCTLKGQPVFMARADIFQSKTVAKILRFFKILPIFRIRDGIKNLQNNDAVFEEAMGVLEAGRRLAILPEGNHHGERRLRALKKGIARIAFQAEERNNFELDIQVVPVGLDYTHYINMGADLMVNFGKPFPISQFKEEYLENNQKGMNAFLKELRSRMLPQMLHIDDADNYDEIETLKDIYIQHLLATRKLKDDHKAIIDKSQQIADKLVALKESSNDEFMTLGNTALKIKDSIKEMGLRYWVPAQKRHLWMSIVVRLFTLLMLFPFFVFGTVVNFLPFYIPVFASKKIKDPQFISSVRFVASLITFTLFYLIYLVLLLIFVKPWIAAIGIFATMMLTGFISFRYFVGIKKTWSKLRAAVWKMKKNEDWLNLKANWENTVNKLADIVG